MSSEKWTKMHKKGSLVRILESKVKIKSNWNIFIYHPLLPGTLIQNENLITYISLKMKGPNKVSKKIVPYAI